MAVVSKSLFLIAFIYVISFVSHATSSNQIERLSLFIHDGHSVYEDRRVADPFSQLPEGLTVSFISKQASDTEVVWEWTLKNTGKSTFNNLRVTGFVDVDIDAPINTFYNEYGNLLALDVPAGYIAPDRWEISEPGYLKGDLLIRAGKGDLKNASDLTTENIDDPAMTLSAYIGSLRVGEELVVTAILASNGNKGLQQQDIDIADKKNNFLFYAKKNNFNNPYPELMQGTLIATGATIIDNAAVIWGFRNSGQQGNGIRGVASEVAPAKVASIADVKAITAGAYHLLALDMQGNVYGWGQSGYGETGCRHTQGIYVSTPCKVLENGVQIAAGEYFSVALDSDGQVWTWGHNLYGQLGNGNVNDSQTPVAVHLNGEKARLIGGAYEGAFAVTEEGHVWAWGDNEASGLGFQGTPYGVQQIIRTPTRVTGLDIYANQITYIAGGNGWGEALLDDGTVIGWGLHASLGIGISLTNISAPEPVVILKNVEQLFARYVGSFAMTSGGELYTWGQTRGSAFPMVYGHTATLRANVMGRVVAIGGGKEHLFYKTDEGKLYGVGYNDLYKLNQGTCCGPNIDWPGSEIIF